MVDLTYITKLFGEAYDVSKQADENKKDMKNVFFKALDEILEDEARPHKIVVVPEGEDSSDYVKRLYPGWRIFRATDDPQRVEIERDPSLMRYTFINPTDKRVYARTTVEAGPSLDEEKLQREDPELWDEISEWVPQVKDPSTWTPDQIERASRFMIPGKITTKLVPPRDATDEELAEFEEEDA